MRLFPKLRLREKKARKREKSKRDWVDYANLIAVFLAFFAAAGAAYESWRLAKLTQITVGDVELAADNAHADNVESLKRADAALKQAHDNFLNDERPIIYAESDNKDLPFQLSFPQYDPANQRVWWNIYFKNFGRSTASNVKLAYFIKLGAGEFTMSQPGIYRILGFGSGGPLPPGDRSYGTAFSHRGSV
ncbi:MAG TPA: hypothetical protein VMC10_03770, partial [Stellaceae bacterium]|nr:hypothetical protein [Stellaceae bacterium]